MAIRPYAGGGSQAFQGDNQPLYVQNQNELKKAFNQVQASSISGAAPIGSVIMWAGTTANAPSTYAVCNGASLSTTGTYAALFAVIGYRYGGSGANFNLPDFTSNVPVGITGVPVVPSTKITSAASAVDAHTHTVNGTINGSGAPNTALGLGINAGNANTHTHAGATLNLSNLNAHTHAGGTLSGANSNIGNVAAHTHGVVGNTGGQSANHTHTGGSGNADVNHQHTYFRPNTGANSLVVAGGALHTHTINVSNQSADHSHGLLFNSGNANSSNINGSNSNIGNFTYSSPPNLPPYFPGGADINMSTNAVGAPNAGLALAIVSGNADTHTHAAANLTSGTATTINASTPAHTHTTTTTQIIFIIRVS